jgi:hypothetical protein
LQLKRESKFNPEFAAALLVEAIYSSDLKVVARYGITDRTLRNWRKRLSTDAAFSGIFQKKRERFESVWADRLAGPIQKAMDFIGDACETMDPRQKNNPEMIHAVAGALKVMAEVNLTSKALNVGNPGEDPPPESVPEQVFGQPVASGYKQ